MHEAILTYDERLVRRGVLCYWRRSLGIGYGVALMMVMGSVGGLAGTDTATWIVATLIVSTALGLVFPVVLYLVHFRSSMGRLRQMVEPTATFIAKDQTFMFRSSMGTTELNWGAITKVWKFPDLWLILYAQSGFNIMPIACVSSEMRDFIEERVRDSGGQVR